MIATNSTDYDVVICGAGPVGAALALFLAETRPGAELARIALIDSRTLEDAALDDRFIAISHGSRSLLDRIGAWGDASATAIRRIHVSHRGHFGRTLIEAEDYDLSALGYVVRYGELIAQLSQALSTRGLEVIRPATVRGVARGSNTVQLVLDAAGGDAKLSAPLSARYAVHAEGGMFQARNRPDRKAIHRDYAQSAITSFVTCTLLQAATAWERFTEHGPLALLPATQNGESGYALVWCCSPADAEVLMRLDDFVFLEQLHAKFGDRVGDFVTVGPRNVYPLTLKALAATAHGREFAIGNAAQTLHPVAGQGLNLGLRDAFVLASALRENFNDPERCAKAFGAARRIDRAATIRLTDFLPRVFSSRLTPVVAARGAALASLDLLAPLRHVLARQMMNGRR